jgi:hypothetical protein
VNPTPPELPWSVDLVLVFVGLGMLLVAMALVAISRLKPEGEPYREPFAPDDEEPTTIRFPVSVPKEGGAK